MKQPSDFTFNRADTPKPTARYRTGETVDQRRAQIERLNASWETERVICPDCRGVGETCPSCNGYGMVCPDCRGARWIRDGRQAQHNGRMIPPVIRCQTCCHPGGEYDIHRETTAIHRAMNGRQGVA